MFHEQITIINATFEIGAEFHKQWTINKIKVYAFITGTCMYLNGGNSVLNGYNCSRFRHGCPNSSFFTDEVYKRNLFENGGFFLIFNRWLQTDFSQTLEAYTW